MDARYFWIALYPAAVGLLLVLRYAASKGVRRRWVLLIFAALLIQLGAIDFFLLYIIGAKLTLEALVLCVMLSILAALLLSVLMSACSAALGGRSRPGRGD